LLIELQEEYIIWKKPISIGGGRVSSYLIRGLSWVEETTFGSIPGSGWQPFNYALDFDATTTENISEDDILSPNRDEFLRTPLHREVTGRFEISMITGRFLKYAIGAWSPTTDTVTPYEYTISPATTLKSFSLRRILQDTQNTGYYYGCKVDSGILNLEVQEDVTLEINFAASGSSFSTATLNPDTINLTYEPYKFYHGKVLRGGSTLAALQSCVVEINNNLEARWTASTGKRDAYQLREGPLRVTGNFTLGEDVESVISDILNNNTFDLQLELSKPRGPGETLTVTIKNCILTEWRDRVSGRDIYEVEFPYLALPSTGLDVIKAEIIGAYTIETSFPT